MLYLKKKKKKSVLFNETRKNNNFEKNMNAQIALVTV